MTVKYCPICEGHNIVLDNWGDCWRCQMIEAEMKAEIGRYYRIRMAQR